MSFLFENNAVSTLLAGITNVATTLTVQAGDGALFPNPTGGDTFRATLQDASNNIEIVEVTSRAVDVFTIVRGQEGTTPLAWLAGDVVELRLTKEILASYRQGVGDEVQTTAISRAVGLADVHDFIEVTAAATITLADASGMGQGYQIHIKNANLTADVTLARATGTDTIDGVAANQIVGPGCSVYISVNATVDGYITLYNNTAHRAYPVGAIYLTTAAGDPQTALGFGSWTQIAQGRTLIGEGTGAGLTARTAGAELGVEDAIVVAHSHTASQAPHSHKIPTGATSGNADNIVDEGDSPNATNVFTDVQTPAVTVNSTGSSGVDQNMQPSLVVYIWERTG